MRCLLLLFCASLSFAQFNSSAPSGAQVVQSNPNGNTCTTATAKAKIYQGTIYTCQSGAYAAVGGGGSATPGGSSGAVQFNDSGALGGAASYVVNGSALSSPAAPTVSVQGAPGASTWGYEISARNAIGPSVPSSETTVSTGNATLSGSNYNLITAPACAAGATSFDVWRTTVPGGAYITGLIGNVPCSGTLHDVGLPYKAPLDYTPSHDATVGVGTSYPIISSGRGSAFGSLAQANLPDNGYSFYDVGQALGVYETTTTGYSPFAVMLIGDKASSGGQAASVETVVANSTVGGMVGIYGAVHGPGEASILNVSSATANYLWGVEAGLDAVDVDVPSGSAVGIAVSQIAIHSAQYLYGLDIPTPVVGGSISGQAAAIHSADWSGAGYNMLSEGASSKNRFEGDVTTGTLHVTLHTPASSSEACTAGQIADDASFHYACTATNTWKRVALSSF